MKKKCKRKGENIKMEDFFFPGHFLKPLKFVPTKLLPFFTLGNKSRKVTASLKNIPLTVMLLLVEKVEKDNTNASR